MRAVCSSTTKAQKLRGARRRKTIVKKVLEFNKPACKNGVSKLTSNLRAERSWRERAEPLSYILSVLGVVEVKTVP
jgi:hypothetical protein